MSGSELDDDDDWAEETLLGTGMEESADPLIEALRTLAELRAALGRGDAEAVRFNLDLHAFGSGKRGLLSTLAGTRSVESAVSRLAPFWRSAEYVTEAARVVSPDEVEVYETISPPGVSDGLRTVTLLRRRGGRWRQVTTTDTPDEKLTASLLCSTEPLLLDESIPGAILDLDAKGQLERLRHPKEEWRAALRVGPVPKRGVPRASEEFAAALADTHTIVSVALLPSTDRDARGAQLRWFASATAGLADAIAARHVYLPWSERLLAPQALAVSADAPLADVAALYVHIVPDSGWTFSRGMSHIMLPEVEARWVDWGGHGAATAIVTEVARALRDGGVRLEPRQRIRVGGAQLWVDYGRRGAHEGSTYGRFGSYRLAPATT